MKKIITLLSLVLVLSSCGKKTPLKLPENIASHASHLTTVFHLPPQ